MIVSHRHRFIFLKTRKTGGTSIEIALRTLGADADDVVTPIVEDRTGVPGIKPQNYLRPKRQWPLRDRLQWALGYHEKKMEERNTRFLNHTIAKDAREELGDRIWSSYYKFSVERNPWDRQVSFYYWTMARWNVEYTFPDFIASSRPIDNWSVYAIGDGIAADHIIRYNGDLQAGLDEALAKVGITAPRLTQAKGGSRPKGRSYRDLFDETTTEIIRKRHQREIDYFGWTF
jgi:hypothetical protein